MSVIQRSLPSLARGFQRFNSASQARWFSTGAVKDDVPMSFIEKAKLKGANALLGQFVNRGDRFDSCLSGLTITKIENGSVSCTLAVDESVQNSYGTLHGGAICTLVDVVGTLAIISIDPRKAGVSVDLNVSFCSAAKAGSVVEARGTVTKLGGKLGFTSVEVFDQESGKIIASGRHTKAV